jgi:crossover junction endodeoxyribonuclease RuvC
VDPGTRFLGYGVVEERRGHLSHVAHGVIRSPASALEQRLAHIFTELSAALAIYRPDAVAVEGVFAMRNPRSALVLGHARGIALLAAGQKGLAVFEYSPAKVKRSVGAGGGDGKEGVQRMVKAFLGIPTIERADASDALALAICHLNAAKAGSAAMPPSRAAAAFSERLSPSYRRFGVEK